MTKYKMKLEQKKKLNQQSKIKEKFAYEAKDSNSPFKWRSDTENTGNFISINMQISFLSDYYYWFFYYILHKSLFNKFLD